MQKEDRQNELLRVIRGGGVSNQGEIASQLAASGYLVTQASVSRDLVELGVVKLNGYYSLPPRKPALSEYGSVELSTAGDNLIVGRCDPGLASAVTVRIDSAEIPEIVGTIAGDDTIFIAVTDVDGRKVAIERINEIFY